MHPAFSVIFFTTSSGAGYGLLALLGALLWRGDFHDASVPGLAILVIGLGLVTAGLLSSTFHLGHPERAWRAFSQWRSSWLSREGVLAVLTYAPAGLLGLLWFFPDAFNLDTRWPGLVLSCLSLLTVYATAMIYRSLATIRQWSNKWTVPCYVVFAVMTGSILMNAVLTLGGQSVPAVSHLAWMLCLAGYTIKKCYWRHIDGDEGPGSAATATGLDHLGDVTVFETPHNSDNYLLREMGFAIGRKHARKLRKIASGFGFLLPLILCLLSSVDGGLAPVWAVLAVVSASVGIFAERWLFFAEARHAVTLYYGADRV